MTVFVASGQFAALTSWNLRNNTASLSLPIGSAELEFLSPSTFRLQRCFTDNCVSRKPYSAEAVAFTFSEDDKAITFRTAYIAVHLDKSNAVVCVDSLKGKRLLSELPLSPGGAYIRVAAGEEKLYGLGSRSSTPLDLRGQTIETNRALLTSSAGFGQFFSVPTSYTFDLARSHRSQIHVRARVADRFEYFFYYGPSPKEILEEHLEVTGAIPVEPFHVGILRESQLPRHATILPRLSLADSVAQLQHAAFSAVLAPAVDLGRLREPLAAYFPLAFTSAPESLPSPIRRIRRSLEPYLYTYLKEARDRGVPILRPMAMQYHSDPTAVSRTSQFMLGDEMLLTSIRELYLPQGLWTNLSTNGIHRGRQVLYLSDSPEPQIFAHNGTIVPLLRPDNVIELHYLPRLGAEFFLAEPGDEHPTQVHAAPAGDILRLEIEPRATHEFEWIIHHVSPVEKIEPRIPYRYDEARRNLHIRVKAPADADIILNISLKEPL